MLSLSLSRSMSAPPPTPMPKTGWFFVGDAPSSQASEAPSKVADAPQPLSRHSKKFGPAMATAMFSAGALAGPGSKNKTSKRHGFRSLIFNPQAERPQRSLKTPYSEYSFAGEYASTLFTTSMAVPTNGAESYTLSTHFPDASNFTSLFDEYRIDQIEVWLEPAMVISSSAGSSPFVSAVDLDDANTPANFADVSGRQGAVEGVTGTGHYHKWKPNVATALYSGTFTSYGNITSTWVDCASPSVQHYGLKYATNSADGVTRPYYRTVRMLVTFRGPAI